MHYRLPACYDTNMKIKITLVALFLILFGVGFLGIKEYQEMQQENLAKELQIQALQRALVEVQKEMEAVKAQSQTLQAPSTRKVIIETQCPPGQYYGDNVAIFAAGVCESAGGGPAKCNVYEKNQYPSVEECKLKNNLE